jgi:hypothetical protein
MRSTPVQHARAVDSRVGPKDHIPYTRATVLIRHATTATSGGVSLKEDILHERVGAIDVVHPATSNSAIAVEANLTHCGASRSIEHAATLVGSAS